MSKIKQSAFACASSAGHQAGMALRDYFAAAALAGWMANPTSTPVEAGLRENATPQDMATVAAAFAYMVADAMLEESKKEAL